MKKKTIHNKKPQTTKKNPLNLYFGTRNEIEFLSKTQSDSN